MKKKLLASVLAGVIGSLAVLSLTGCNLIQKSSSISSSSEQTVGGYTHPDFVTQYTPGEHVRRIEERTKQRFASELASGVIKDFTVEIIYAFYDDDPEYFMVQLEYRKEWDDSYECDDYTNSAFYGEYIEYTTKYKHIIGYISNDNYMTGLYEYLDDFRDGRSSYAKAGYEYAKKYYGGGVHAVEKDGQKLTVYENQYSSSWDAPPEFEISEKCLQQRFLTEEQEKRLMRSNFKLFSKVY